MKIFMLVPTVCLMVCSCAVDTKPNCPVRIDKNQNEVSPADWEITMAVKQVLLNDGLLAPGNRFVSISTTDGVVTVSGKVAGQDQMDEIVRRIESICGVVGVNNQMILANN